MLWSVPFLPHESGNQAKKPGPEEVLTRMSGLFGGSETQWGPRKAPEWGKEGRGTTLTISVALGVGESGSESHLCLSPNPSICSKSTPKNTPKRTENMLTQKPVQ